MRKILLSVICVLATFCASAQQADTLYYEYEGSVIYKVNKWFLQNDELQRALRDSIIPNTTDKGYQFDRISISGAASPEGSYQWNQFLSKSRYRTALDTIYQYLEKPLVVDIDDIPEDYDFLVRLLRQNNDNLADYVGNIVDNYRGDPYSTKKALKRNSKVWYYLLSKYYPALRAARYKLYFSKPVVVLDSILAKDDTLPVVVPDIVPGVIDVAEEEKPLPIPMLALRSNLLYDLFYMPRFGFAPAWDLHAEFYPLRGKFTYNAGITWPYWKKWDKYKFFQIEDINLEVRRYFKHNDYSIYKGWYVGASADLFRYGIGFDKETGWEGEGVGLSLTGGCVLPISRNNHWKLHFHVAFGGLYSKYDPYVYGNPFTRDESTDLYYYKYYGLKDNFNKRRFNFFYIGPTNVGISISYDILYYNKKYKLRK